MKRQLILIDLIALLLGMLVMMSGCATTVKWDKQAYKDLKATGQQGLESWSLYSGMLTCGMGGQQVKFPITLSNAQDLESIFNNPTIISGIAKLDYVTQQTIDPKTSRPYFKQDEWAMGCVIGTKTKMTLSQVIAILKVAYPQAAAFLPAF